MISLALIFRARTGQLVSRRSLSLDLFHSVDSGCTFSVATPRTMVSCESGYTHTPGVLEEHVFTMTSVRLSTVGFLLFQERMGGQHLMEVITATSFLLTVCCLDQRCAF